MQRSTNKTTPEEIWAILKQTAKQGKEIDQRMKEMAEEADQRMKTMAEEADKRKKEADQRMQKMAEEADKRQIEIDKMRIEANKETQQINKRMRQLDELFTGQWGKLMESLVRGDLIKLLNKKGIKVRNLAQITECKFNNKDYEFDIIAVNGNEIVVVEVKTTLRLKDLDYFIDNKLKDFKTIFPEFKKKTIYGAVAYLKSNQSSSINAEKRGLFVIRATGNSSSITNATNFKPKTF